MAIELEGEGFRQHHPRVYEHPGVVIDLGCLSWNWSRMFQGKKRIIGFDPQETECPDWAELRNEIVGISEGSTLINIDDGDQQASSIFIGTAVKKRMKTVSMRNIVDEYGDIALLKMNIEGAEFPLLTSMPHPIADQIVLSWHEWLDPSWRDLSRHLIDWMNQWYDYQVTCKRLNWGVFLAKK